MTTGQEIRADAQAFAAVRKLFPGAERNIYMNVAVRGLLPTPVRAAVEEYLDRHVAGDIDKPAMFATVERARERFASMVNATPDEIAIAKNSSEALNMIAASLPWSPGDNLVLCPELEHPNNVYPWMNVGVRFGVDVRTVEPEDGRIPIERMIGAMDERTRLVTVPTVTFSPGFVTAVEPLAAVCRERGVISVVDAAQSVGVLNTDVKQMGVDALAVATQKALCAFYGMGFLFCRRDLADQITPAYLARFGVAVGADAHETAMHQDALRLADGARRFDLGNYNFLGATAANSALGLLLDIGTRDIESHVRSLSARLATGLLGIGLPVVGGEPGPDLGHIVAVGVSGAGRHDTVDDPEMNSLSEYLLAHGVRFAIRRGVLRFSLHVYNNRGDVDALLALAEEWLRSRSAR